MRKLAAVVSLCLAVFGFTACMSHELAAGRVQRGFANDRQAADLDDSTVGRRANDPSAGAFYDDGGRGDVRARTENAFAAAAKTERLLVQRGDLQVEVPRPEDALRAFVAAAQERGGYLQNQSASRAVVRVPAAKFDELFAFVRTQGRVLAESRSADDVTEEFVDLGIRLDNARKARERLTEILQKADKVEDILRVEAELRRLTEEIERMEGRRKFLADQVAMATLTAQFQAAFEPPPPPRRQKAPSR